MKVSWSGLGSEKTKTALVALLLCCAPLSQACGGVARFDHDGSGGSGAIGSSGGSASNSSMGGSVSAPQGVGGSIAPIVGGSGAGGPIAPQQGGSGPIAPQQGGSGPIAPQQGGSGPIAPSPCGSGPVGPNGSASKGAQVWAEQVCAACHQENAAGNYAPNITPSCAAGIGKWTYQQFHDAVRDGQEPSGRSLCAAMTRFPASEISDEDMLNLYAYLRSKPAVDIPNTGSFCP